MVQAEDLRGVMMLNRAAVTAIAGVAAVFGIAAVIAVAAVVILADVLTNTFMSRLWLRNMLHETYVEKHMT